VVEGERVVVPPDEDRRQSTRDEQAHAKRVDDRKQEKSAKQDEKWSQEEIGRFVPFPDHVPLSSQWWRGTPRPGGAACPAPAHNRINGSRYILAAARTA